MSASTSEQGPARPDGPFAMFRAATSATGALNVSWTPQPGSAFRVWVLLRDPQSLTPDDLHPQRLLPYLLRIPVPPGASSITVHVPVGRPLGVCIVGRDTKDGPQSIIPDDAVDVALDVDPAPAPMVTAAPTPLAAIDRTVDRPELVLAPGSSHEAMAALAARMAAAAPSPSQVPSGPTGFGLRQQWYLARLAFAPAQPGLPRVVVHRPTFIAHAELRQWSEAPPEDAVRLPDGCDGIIDANTPEDAMSFFVVLQGPSPWQPVALAPASPPFDDIRSPFVLGDAAARLSAIERRNANASPVFFDILHAARRDLP